MNAEHELRVLEVDPKEVGAKILSAGGKLVQKRTLQKRYTYNVIPINENKWIRLRTNGSKATIAVKHVTGSGMSDTKEVEIEVDSFETAAKLMEQMGMKVIHYQENYRATYELDSAEIMVDEWPLIPPHLEVEAASVEVVNACIKKLGFQPDEATGLDVSSIAKQIYKVDVDAMPELKFDSAPKKPNVN